MIGYQKIEIDKLPAQMLRKQLQKNPTGEICGALGGIKKNRTIYVASVYPIQNQSNRSNGFALSVNSLMEASSHFKMKGFKFLGIYHSHPSGLLHLSLRDLWLIRNTGIPLMIIVRFNHSFEAIAFGPVRRQNRIDKTNIQMRKTPAKNAFDSRS
ncbi:Mov34/MPN/PAD-1 family protein [bacterium]|nr:Mov34/MPN/PAD-1 family protein [bacterium]